MVRYSGKGPTDAACIIESSHGQYGENAPTRGHPRAHVSDPSAKKRLDSVERYSFTKHKTGFLTKEDQDLVVHTILGSKAGTAIMDALNNGSDKKGTTSEIDCIDAGEWYKGEPVDYFTALEADLVVQHRKGLKRKISADPHILTCFPKRPKYCPRKKK